MIKDKPNKNISRTFRMPKPEFIRELLEAQKEKTIKVKDFFRYYSRKV